jgi:hypothetical protein
MARAGAMRRRGRGRGEIVGHGQASRLRSIRVRLLVPVSVAIAGLILAGALLTRNAVDDAAVARQARQLVALTSVTFDLDTAVENEIAEVGSQRLRGGTVGIQLLQAQQARTDQARTSYMPLAEQVRLAEPGLKSALDGAERMLSRLSAARISVNGGADDLADGLSDLGDLNAALLAVLERMPAVIKDGTLANQARSVAALAEAIHLAAQQRDLLRGALARHGFDPGEAVQFAALRGGEVQRIDEFTKSASAANLARWDVARRSQDVADAEKIQAGALAAAFTSGGPSGLDADPDVWYIAQSANIRLMRDVGLDAVDDLQDSAADSERRAVLTAIIVGASVLLVAAATLATAIVVSVRTSRRLRRLRASALAVAHSELPSVISQVATAPSAVTVQSALEGSSALADPAIGGDSDEVGQVAAALHAVHRQALRLAADQALLRLDVSALFIALSRRGQSLVHRQLQLIDDFESAETNPETLDRLFAIDHLAARMRRNEENLLVLAGGEPTRQFSQPEPLHDVIRAAGAEIEDYERIDIASISEISVAAWVVGDIVHLLAELLENATTFSAPNTRVRVSARRSIDGVSITVFDEGIGMTPAQVEEANARLAQPETLTSALAGTMGLLVVARLAVRRGIRVRLRSTLSSGTIAFVDLPNELLAIDTTADDPSQPTVEYEQWRPLWRGPALSDRVSPALARSLPSAAASPALAAGPPQSTPALAEPAVTASAASLIRRRPRAEKTLADRTRRVLARMAEVENDEPTTGILPQRRPGELLVPAPEPGRTLLNNSSHHQPARATTAPLDPEVVRARLSSLAGGIAAARRET